MKKHGALLAALLLTISYMLGFVTPVVALASANAANITARCRIRLGKKRALKLHDGNLRTGQKLTARLPLEIALPADGAGYIKLEWTAQAADFRLIQFDARWQKLCVRTLEDAYAGISMMFPLEPQARYVSVRTKTAQSLSEVSLYAQGKLPKSLPNWQPPHEKCDLMVVSAHQDDEWLWFGGILPYYQDVQHKNVQMVYMANCGRSRYNEALNGLWAGGMRHYPEFLGFKDERIGSYQLTLKHWGGEDELLRRLVACIRRYQPEVILTHDKNGEYGHNQHRLTARCMENAIRAAADPARYPESARQYGAWQVKKLYRHLEKKGQIRFNWSKRYAELGGKSPYEIACLGYAKHKSQQRAYQMTRGGKYDNALFGLSYSVVGEDVLHTDLFENL